MNRQAYSNLIKTLAFDSSFIETSEYKDGLMTVSLKNGQVYTYKDVPQNVYDEFLASDSKGVFYNKVIKPTYKLTAF